MAKEKANVEQKRRRDRHDGLATKTSLLECAARLTAQKGFAQVTSKEICQLARTNPAAVNYHFGGRRSLYKELLLHIHQKLIDEEWLKQLATMPLDTEAKLERLIDRMTGQLWAGCGACEKSRPDGPARNKQSSRRQAISSPADLSHHRAYRPVHGGSTA